METQTYRPESVVPYGPLLEETMLSSGLDYYKPTMSQVQHEQYPDAEVTFTFKNRNNENLTQYVNPATLNHRLEAIRERGWSETELGYFASLQNGKGERMFSDSFVNYLRNNELPPVQVGTDPETNDLAITTTGEAPLVTFWETVVMSEVNELYFESVVQQEGLDLFAVYEEGDRRLQEKIAILQANPDIHFSDFGTRRHFSRRWQSYVLDQLREKCPDNFMGTSNVGFAITKDVKAIGTFAHEMPMVYAGLADATGHSIRDSHNRMLQDWYGQYDQDLSIALTDTFGSDFFFEDFTAEQAQQWRGLRHDSGDPFEFGEKALAFYEANNVDPTTKTIVFSDGLDMQTIVELHNYFKGRVNVVFGWGTTLTNDLGLPALNIVMKATHVKTVGGDEADLVKLSDNVGKHTGPQAKVDQYEQEFAVAR